MPSPYRSPTKRLAAEVVVDDGALIVGDLHLHPNTLVPGGYESVVGMINDNESFFPISDGDTTITLVGKARTVSLSYTPDEDALAPDGAETRVRLEARLSDGRTLSGWGVVELPRAHGRTLDFLNGPGPFLPLHDGTRVHLVNRAHIRTVHPLD